MRSVPCVFSPVRGARAEFCGLRWMVGGPTQDEAFERVTRCPKATLGGDGLGRPKVSKKVEALRERFLEALSELSGGGGEGKPAMVSDVAKRAGLDPEGNPDDRALSERLAAELVEVGHASAEAGSGGFLAITPEGERVIRGDAT